MLIHHQSASSHNVIDVPSIQSEFEIQAFIFYELRKIGFDVRGEVPSMYYPENGTSHFCIFDIVIFNGGRATRIIEVKNGFKETNFEHTRQYTRYRQFGVPVTFVKGMDSAIKLIEYMRRLKEDASAMSMTITPLDQQDVDFDSICAMLPY